MNLIDDLKQMKKKGRQVVSIDYVLKSLRESQRHDNEIDGDLSISESNIFARLAQEVKGVI